MPYEPDKCTFSEPLEKIGRQHVYACLTCFAQKRNALPKIPLPNATSVTDYSQDPIGICYSCSIQCHAEHDLVELFTKRNFTCDCGTTRMPDINPTTKLSSGCNLRRNHDSLDPPESTSNIYGHNFQGRFCDCDQVFDPEDQRGTMFQCLLGDEPCNEDWYHEECILGIPLGSVYKDDKRKQDPTEQSTVHNVESQNKKSTVDQLPVAKLEREEGEDEDDDTTLEDLPNIDQFDSFICWKCIQKNLPLFEELVSLNPSIITAVVPHSNWKSLEARNLDLKKRPFDNDDNMESKNTNDDTNDTQAFKKAKLQTETPGLETNTENQDPQENKEHASETLSFSKKINPKFQFSLFLAPEFRQQLKQAVSNYERHQSKKDATTPQKSSSSPCISSSLYKFLTSTHPYLTVEEMTYEPPPDRDLQHLSDDDLESNSSGISLFEAGARALNEIPRQQAIQGIEAYAVIKQKLSEFFKPFAEQGKVVTEQDVTGFFDKIDQEKKESRN